MADKFDLVVIGGGNGGYISAIRASQLGMSVALIERRPHLGGTCLNLGCIPTKALLQSAARLHDARNGADFGVNAGEVKLDYAQAIKRKDQVVDQLRRGVQGLMKKNNVRVLTGTGSFAGPQTVTVKGGDGAHTELEGSHVLIASGSAVSSLPGLELDGERVISSDDVVTSAKDPPESIIVLGSGAVGVEFASMYADFGTNVTLVELMDRIVPAEDPDVSAELRKAFERRGIRVITSAKANPSSLQKTDHGVQIEVTDEDGKQTLEADALLVAVGRRTVVDDLDLDATGVEVNDSGQIRVDEFYRTAEPGIYAAGDVIGGYWLAHAAAHEGIVAVEHMAGKDPLPIDQNLIPRVTFCRPEIASFGLTRRQAEQQGHKFKESKFPFRAIGKALIEGDPDGFFKIVADAETDRILGMHAIGPHVTDLIAEGVFAKLVEGTPQELGMSVHAHPTLSEIVGEAAMAVDGVAIHY
ncbi:MAG: dihydrolipoyl dehydrogenase [Actinomycetota bacterium]|nr:dihydrolipoyl dehydrogenase [Actinomycetota bacterium]